MANTLVYAEIHDGKVKTVTLEILEKLVSKSVDVVTMDKVTSTTQQELATKGVENIFSFFEADFNYTAEASAKTLHEFISSNSYQHIFTGSTSFTRDLFPRLAGKSESVVINDLIELEFEGEKPKVTRPIFGGKCLANVETNTSAPLFYTVRPNALGLSNIRKEADANITKLSQQENNDLLTLITDIAQGASDKLDLTEANIIIAGGRALKSSDDFKILDQLANTLGATVGATRSLVDAGIAPHSMQIGQTGKTVAPSLYIACGISGAIQHLAGMQTSKIIIAINNDPDAPIFNKADYGIVGDLFQIVPLLDKEFKKLLT